VAQRLGISQSDVSRLESRTDVRLSTLRAYASAIGARLEVNLHGPHNEGPGPLALGQEAKRITLPRAAAPGR
jgi:hypothetical protein